LIDPCGGRQDLESRTLRHVSPAFAEDPLRVLRVARFAARYAPFGFRIADETLALMQGMVNQGEVDHLVPERIWKETERALMQSDQAHAEGVPSVYFRVLHQCGALARVMPELADLHGVPQRPEHHPEVDTLLHTLLSLDVTAKAGEPLEVRVAALLHDLGKALTPPEQWPRHIAHEHRGLPRVKQFCERLRVPNAARDLAMIVAAEHLLVHRCQELRPDTLLKLLERCDALRRPQRFEQVLAACRADARGRSGREQDAYPQAEYLRAAAHAAQVDPQSVIADGFGGADIGVEIRKRRLVRLKRFVAERS
ncbi:MAG: HD domain-containing protein, partial [Panacagrimonas sp.]